MRIRDYVQETQDDMGTSGTLTYPLDFSDPITEIDLLFEATNGGSGNKDNPIELNITKIEIVDGGEVLWDLPGEIAFSYASHINNQVMHRWGSGAPSGSPWIHIPIRFGRYLYDRELAFNPSAHRNPQLKVTFNEATIRAASATAFSSDSFTLTMLVKLMEQVNAPAGFLSCREVEQYTSLGSGDKVTLMPTDKLIRAMFVRAWITSVHLSSIISQHKLSADGGKYIPFDLPYRSMRAKMTSYFTPLTIAQYVDTDDGEYHQSWVGDAFHCTVRCNNAGHIVTTAGHSGGRLLVNVEDNDGSGATGKTIMFAVRGLPIHHTLIYPFGRLNEPVDWFDPRDLKKLDYIASQGSAGADVDVCVQQLFSY